MTDKLMTGDLAALAVDNRRELPSLAETLRELGVYAPPRGSEATPSSAFTLMALARVYAHRVARAAAGAMLLACVAKLLVAFWHGADRRGASALYRFLDLSLVHAAVIVAVLAMIAHRIALAIATYRFERDMRAAHARGEDPVALGRARVRGVDRSAIALWLGGLTATIVMFGILWLTLGGEPLRVMLGRDPWWPYFERIYSADGRVVFEFSYFSASDVVRDQTAIATLASLASTLVAIAIARVCARPRWGRALAHRMVVVAGLVLAAATIHVGVRHDVGPIETTLQWIRLPSTELRVAFAASAVLAVTLVLAGLVLRTRRRDHERCALEDSP
jgi:hypothetical protein